MPLARIAEQAGTPAYVYSRSAIEATFRELDRSLARLPHTICYAVKANGNLSILRLLAGLGSGFDIVSGGELERLRTAGVPGDRIVFSGVGKTREEIREALQYPSRYRDAGRGILLFNIESEAELVMLTEEAARNARHQEDAPSVAVRINPDVQAGGHPHISTGRREHKFGLDWPAARRLYLAHRDSRWVRWQGISAHIGSQVLSLEPFRRALRRLASHFLELRGAGIALRYFDFGGGLGVRYTDQQPPSRAAYARMVRGMVEPLGCHLLLEPGRSIIAQAGVLLTRVLYTKENRGRAFVVVDAGMNDLMRPSLYAAVHPITPVTRARAANNPAAPRRVDVVGPVCETGDCFLHDWPLPPVAPGDVLAIWCVGAYGMSLSSNYNARPRAVEVLVEGNRCRVIRPRETLAELMRNELFPPPDGRSLKTDR
ncbi:MAG: diaminopimelate decarboxylase [Acidobacteria bacterium 13_1_20CM_2_60_10]|nr:MAG: diaminopimelate decarboxylase [Acidobacteria bacterium 13_1_20CM_2_60_10]